ncbi:MAG: DUF6268 family outer membrane beta-barrel protein [Kiritimatiellia bacterium]|nr:DUF6268 family outer membrane beta-barrel protein [Lentisphaerota bacterium]
MQRISALHVSLIHRWPLLPALLTGLLAWNTPLGAQPARRLVDRQPLAAISYTLEHQAGFHSDTIPSFDRVRMHETDLQVGWPLWLGERWRLFNGLGWHWYRFEFSGPGAALDKDVYVINMPFRLMTPAPENWSFMFMIAPGLQSDMGHLTLDDVRHAFLGIGTYRYSEELRISVGLVYSRIFGSEMLFPAAGLIWDPRPEWQVNLTFPRPAVIYTPTSRLRLAAGLTPSGNEWNISHESADGQSREYDLRFKGYRMGVSADYRLTERLGLRAAGGLVLFRDYELLLDNRTLSDNSVRETWFLQVGLALH